MKHGTALVVSAATLLLAACSGSSGDELTKNQVDYLTTAGTIDGRLTGDRALALELGQGICAQLAAGKPEPEVIADVQRFSQGEGVISKDQAAQLVTAVKQNLCGTPR